MTQDKINDEITRFIKYIRRMNSIQDDQQLEILLTMAYNNNPETYTSIGVDIKGHIRFIRQMAKYSDDKLKQDLRKRYENDPVFVDMFENNSKRNAIKEMQILAKDLHSDPRKFARKIDQEFR